MGTWTGFQIPSSYIFISLRVVLILSAAWLFQRLLGKLVPRLKQQAVNAMRRHAGGSDLEINKRADTLSGIAGKVFAFALWFTAIMTALREVGFDLGPILAGPAFWALPSVSAPRAL